MRKRYQKGSLRKVKGVWIAQWWEEGHRRKRTLGKTSQVTKTEAQTELAAILAPINAGRIVPSARCKVAEFITGTFLPFYRRKWKRSTAMCNEDRLERYITAELGDELLADVTRIRLQDFLDEKALSGLSFSVVAHLRWDLRQIFRMAQFEGFIQRSPAELLFVPREAKRYEARVMTRVEVKSCLDAFDINTERRQTLIVKLALLAGLRPGELFALRCGRVRDGYAEIAERVYRRELDSPKTRQSVRKAVMPKDLFAEVRSWIADLPNNGPEDWVFPSERVSTPLSPNNVWRRDIQPKLERLGLGWANYQVFRRTHATLMRESGADAKLVADNMGHSVDVNQNVYAQTPLPMRQEAVDALASTVYVN